MVSLALLILIGGCASFEPREPAPLTKLEAKAMRPDTLNRRLFGDTARTLLPIDRRRPPDAPEPQLPLERLDFISPARSSSEAGLCWADYVIVLFEPVAEREGAETRVRPVRFTSTPVFMVYDPTLIPTDRLAPIGDPQFWERQQEACAELDPRAARLIFAPSEWIAGFFLRRTFDVIAAARQGRREAPLECEGDAPLEVTAEADCLARVARVDPRRLSTVEPCTGPLFPREPCFTVSDGLNAFDFTMRPETEVVQRVSYYQRLWLDNRRPPYD